jgi:hypothetical protein
MLMMGRHSEIEGASTVSGRSEHSSELFSERISERTHINVELISNRYYVAYTVGPLITINNER